MLMCLQLSGVWDTSKKPTIQTVLKVVKKLHINLYVRKGLYATHIPLAEYSQRFEVYWAVLIFRTYVKKLSYVKFSSFKEVYGL